MSGLIRFEDQDKFFIKFFLLDATLNLNKWGVTERSLRDGLDSFVGKPFVLTADFDHPNAENGDDLMIQQEKYRVGNIIMVGLEERTGKAYGVAEITNKEAIDILKSGDVNFVSPSIVFNSSDEYDKDGNAIIESWEGAHVAAVAEPAYTIEKAQIKGRCSGDRETCLNSLQRVQASRSPCGKYTLVTMPGKRIIGNASNCVEECIRKKTEHGKEIDDQALAICYSECGKAQADKFEEEKHERDPDGKFTSSPESDQKEKKDKVDFPQRRKEQRKQDRKRKENKVQNFIDEFNERDEEPPTLETILEEFPNMAEEELVDITLDYYEELGLGIDVEDREIQRSNIDQKSLENITKIHLWKKKKKQAQDPEITSKNKKKIIMPKKASIFVKSKKTKEQHLKELEEYDLQMQSFNRKKGVTEEEYRKHTSIK